MIEDSGDPERNISVANSTAVIGESLLNTSKRTLSYKKTFVELVVSLVLTSLGYQNFQCPLLLR